MQSELWQWATDVRVKLALAILAASTLVAAAAMPAPPASVPPASVPQVRPASQSVSVEAVTTSVAVLPMAEVTPQAGSASPEGPAGESSWAEDSSNDDRSSDDSSPAEGSAAPAATGADAAPAGRVSEATVSHNHRAALSAASLCLAPGSNPECAATFNAALRSALAPADVVVTANGSAEIVGPRGAQPLHFQKRAPWVRRLETIGKEGIPFVRIQRGPDREVVVGINRKGVLGVSLHERRD